MSAKASSDASNHNQTVTVTPGSDAAATVARVYHVILALLGTSAMAISLYNGATRPEMGDFPNGWVFELSYFTIWSNIFVLIVNWSLFANPRRDDKIFRWLRLTSLVMIVITGLVYAIVLAPSASVCGTGYFTNTVFHYIVPWATLLGFLLFGPRPRLTWDLLWKCLAIPILWLIYTILRGLLMVTPPGDRCSSDPAEQVLGQPQNWYPYPFINPDYADGAPSALIPGLTAPGYAGIAINIVGVIALGLIFSTIFIGIDRGLSKGEKPAHLD